MKKRCRHSKSCGAGCISNAKFCRVGFPTAVNNVLDKASHQVGVVELYKAAAAGGKRGGAAQFEKIRGELRQELGRNIRAGEDAKELKRRLVAAGVIPAKGSPKPKAGEDAGEIFKKAIEKPESVPSALRQELNQLAAKDQQVKLEPRQLEKSPGARTKTVLPAKRSIDDEKLMDDISRLMRGESPKHISMVGDDSARVKIKSQIAQLQSVLSLGVQTRKEVGRDLEGLLDEAKNLEGRLMSQQKGFKGNDQERLALLDRLKKVREAIKGPATKATGNVRYAREDARDHDNDMLAKGISRELGSKTYLWEESYGSGSKLLGKGAFGTVLREPNKGNAVKRGEIGIIEADLIKRLGDVDLGPKLLAAQIDGPGYNPKTKLGRLAMSVVAGSPIGSKEPDKEIGGVKVADAYWTARANLHRMGIAHNDMHIDNVLIDRKGKARFVDMGLAQDSPKAALAEALGAFSKPRDAMVTRGREAAGQGDWQVRRWHGTGGELLTQLEDARYRGTNPTYIAKLQRELEERAPVLTRVLDNKPAVLYQMKRDGFTVDDFATVLDHGIRSPMQTYEQGVWAKMSNEQAQKYINLLYEGV